MLTQTFHGAGTTYVTSFGNVISSLGTNISKMASMVASAWMTGNNVTTIRFFKITSSGKSITSFGSSYTSQPSPAYGGAGTPSATVSGNGTVGFYTWFDTSTNPSTGTVRRVTFSTGAVSTASLAPISWAGHYTQVRTNYDGSAVSARQANSGTWRHNVPGWSPPTTSAVTFGPRWGVAWAGSINGGSGHTVFGGASDEFSHDERVFVSRNGSQLFVSRLVGSSWNYYTSINLPASDGEFCVSPTGSTILYFPSNGSSYSVYKDNGTGYVLATTVAMPINFATTGLLTGNNKQFQILSSGIVVGVTNASPNQLFTHIPPFIM